MCAYQVYYIQQDVPAPEPEYETVYLIVPSVASAAATTIALQSGASASGASTAGAAAAAAAAAGGSAGKIAALLPQWTSVNQLFQTSFLQSTTSWEDPLAYLQLFLFWL